MKLTRKYIGRLFDVRGSDGSWVYLLVDVRGKDFLFYSFDNKYWIGSNKDHDWRAFRPIPFDSRWIDNGWETGRRID